MGVFKTIKKIQLNSRIKPRMYVWRSTILKNCILLAGTGVKNDSTVVCGFSPIKIHYSDYPKQIIGVLCFFN